MSRSIAVKLAALMAAAGITVAVHALTWLHLVGAPALVAFSKPRAS
jgi:hypothetical protein